jgi:adenylosuccinate synthase
LEFLNDTTVIYETLPGWQQDISKCRTYSELPKNAQAYIERIEQLLETPVEWIGVGAGRDAMIYKEMK